MTDFHVGLREESTQQLSHQSWRGRRWVLEGHTEESAGALSPERHTNIVGGQGEERLLDRGNRKPRHKDLVRADTAPSAGALRCGYTESYTHVCLNVSHAGFKFAMQPRISLKF